MADFLTGMSNYPVTNADRIRAMSDEELVGAFLSGCDGRECPPRRYPFDIYPVSEALEECRNCWLNWLQSPAGEVEDDA